MWLNVSCISGCMFRYGLFGEDRVLGFGLRMIREGFDVVKFY